MDAEAETDVRLYKVGAAGFSAPVGSAGGSPAVKVRGEVDLATVPELLRAIGVACSRLDGQPVAYVDLREAEFVDVYGVRTLVEQAQAMRELGGELRLVVPERGPVARAFGLLGVERVLELYHETAAPDGRRTC